MELIILTIFGFSELRFDFKTQLKHKNKKKDNDRLKMLLKNSHSKDAHTIDRGLIPSYYNSQVFEA